MWWPWKRRRHKLTTRADVAKAKAEAQRSKAQLHQARSLRPVVQAEATRARRLREDNGFGHILEAIYYPTNHPKGTR